ncbi:hypothetical protein P5704_025220 (plasmid) [Pseudomonas sp. FeN3W]|nr:hypothetical protein P5704_025220 [Pseudomonas sp. FeN3W]
MNTKINFEKHYFYHGSPFRIEKFCLSFCGKGNDQIGSGIYCASKKSIAIGYCEADQRKLSTFSNTPVSPTLHKLKLNIKNPLEVTSIVPLGYDVVRQIICGSPALEDALSNFGDIEWEGLDKVMNRACSGYVKQHEVPLISILHMLANDFFDGEVAAFNNTIRDNLGYDSVIEYYENEAIICVWFPEDIEIISRINVSELQSEMEP